MDEVEARIAPPEKIQIYTPGEMATLLMTCSQATRAYRRLGTYLAIGAFAGLRSQEIQRLDWRDVGIGTGSKYIQVSAENAKTRRRRLVPITDNLKAWLAADAKPGGPVWPCGRGTLIWYMNELGKKSGIRWRKNALRHSYISYRLAQIPDVAKVALEAGNSPSIIFRHYRELVMPEAAAEWFAIMPGSASEKIICLKTA